MKNYTKEQKLNITKTVVTAAVLFVMSIGSLIIPLRPSVSETEKRELAKFPDFTVSALLDGSYFSDISLWFSDTVPFRDYFVSGRTQGIIGEPFLFAFDAEFRTVINRRYTRQGIQ